MSNAAVAAATYFGETIGFWIQTGAIFLSAGAASFIIWQNGKLAKRRALIDLIIHLKADEQLLEATKWIYAESNCNPLSSFVNKPEEKKILRVLNSYEFIAVGIRMKAFDEDVYKQLQCSNVLKLWSVTSGFIQEIRKIDEKSTLFQDFECLAKKWSKSPLKQI